MNWPIFISIIVLTLSGYPSWAQSYNYGDNTVRVVDQTSNGLARPSSSYISPGTLSRTAQAGAGLIPQTAGVNPGLPKVNHGAFLGTPGDNMYTDHPDLSQPPKLINQRFRPSRRMIYNQTVKKPENTYVRDPNIPMTYDELKSEPSVQEESKNATANNNVDLESKNTTIDSK